LFHRQDGKSFGIIDGTATAIQYTAKKLNALLGPHRVFGIFRGRVPDLGVVPQKKM
jgi:hypothetical protein